jgi:hypothetical protein
MILPRIAAFLRAAEHKRRGFRQVQPRPKQRSIIMAASLGPLNYRLQIFPHNTRTEFPDRAPVASQNKPDRGSI